MRLLGRLWRVVIAVVEFTTALGNFVIAVSAIAGAAWAVFHLPVVAHLIVP